MNDLKHYQFISEVYQSKNTIIYQARKQPEGTLVIVKTLKTEYPKLEEIARLRNEYNILRSLNIEGVSQPIGLETYQNSLALILKDCGGHTLKEEIDRTSKIEIERFLKIAINLSHTLARLHECRIIHKDIKPHNILLDPKTSEINIIDFSIAIRLERENPLPINPNFIEGTLAYMSPEQTGRMNRSIDYRTDFYSLGITFYEMLTGTLPFTSSDPMELVHCHIAKTPIPPNRIAPEIPAALSAIVMKLLAKTAEKRYQSAAGILADLECCRDRLQSTGEIAEFIPGKLDTSAQFSIPQTLYGRETEVTQLMEIFERTANGSSEITLIAGYSGIGKTAVVSEVHKPIVAARGYFISGKFDQFQRNIPYFAVTQAFSGLIDQLLAESSEKIALWTEQIITALGENAGVIIDVIPELELAIGTQPPVSEVGLSESQSRFNRLFKKFIKVFATREHPLVIFLDDLQWADNASLKLIKQLITDVESQYLLIIAAYRDNEIDPTHPTILTLEEIQKAGITVNSIALKPLGRKDVRDLVADTLHDRKNTLELAELLFNKTQGNPFFLNQLFSTLYQEKLVVFDFTNKAWKWDIARIQARRITDCNAIELVARNICKLSTATQEVLKLAACIGNRFNLEMLAIAHQQSLLTTAEKLWEALQAGLILPRSNAYKIALEMKQDEADAIAKEDFRVSYEFVHDRVQQAVYSLIPDVEKKAIHSRIGQLLLEQTLPSHLEENIFEIVNQLNMGVESIAGASQKRELAQLNLRAGRKAKAATAYQAAVRYLNVGLSLLPERAWEAEYELTRDLHVETLEAEYLNANFERSQQLSELILLEAQYLLDKIKVYELKTSFYFSQNQLNLALDTGLEVLNLLEIDLPTNPTALDVVTGLQQTQVTLQDKRVEDLANLPPIADSFKLAGLRMLVNLIPASYTTNPLLFPPIIFKAIEICIQYGNSSFSPLFYVHYGQILCAMMGDIDRGYEFGQLSLKLAEKNNDIAIKIKVDFAFNAFVRHWREHCNQTSEPFKEGFKIAQGIGKLEDACYCAVMYCSSSLLWAGERLESLLDIQEKYIESILANQMPEVSNLGQIWHNLGHQMLYNTPWVGGKCKIDGFDEEKMLEELVGSNNQTGIAFLHLAKCVRFYVFNDCKQAVSSIQLSDNHKDNIAGLLYFAQQNFYHSLSLLAHYPKATQVERQQYLDRIATNQTQMKIWAHHAPMNFQNKYDLVEAEKNRILGNIVEAMEFYDRAITGAKEQGFIHEEAIANERAAEFYFALDRPKVGQSYLMDAYYAYARWGAIAKIKELEVQYPDIFIKQSRSSRDIRIDRSTTSTTELTKGSLDLATVMKASQALADEIVLQKLLKKLLKIVMESAGAQTGCLILEKEGQLQIEAIGCTDPEWVEIRSHTVAETSERLPVSVLNYALRTRSTVVLHHAEKIGRFIADPYIVKTQPKSILCIPIFNRGQFIGLLYLENNQTTDAFNSERVEVLKILSGQIAISLKNALLYANLAAATQQLESANERLEDYSHTLEVRVERRSQELQQKNQDLEQILQKLRRTQTQLIQTEKMSSLGQLVAGVAHEINNPINFIYGNLIHAGEYVEDLLDLLDRYEEGYPNPLPEIADCIEDIELDFLKQDFPRILASMHAGAERIGQIVRSLRNFSRLDEADMKAVDINEGIESTLAILQHRLNGNTDGEAIAVVKEYGQLPLVECYASQLNQVFMNVLSNAIDALEAVRSQESGSTIGQENTDRASECINRLSTSTAHPSPLTPHFSPTIRIRTQVENERVTIRIADNGSGMTDEVKSKVFDPFFTTKPVGSGTGLGLSVSYQIVVEKHRGQLQCSSVPGQGSEFAIAIPLKLRK